MQRDTVLERIRKCLRLAGDSGATEAEASTAMAMAHKLLLEHDLEMEEVSPHDGPRVPGTGVFTLRNGVDMGHGHWRARLWYGVARANYCNGWRGRGKNRRRFYLVGTPTNIQATRIMGAWIIQKLEQLALLNDLQQPKHIHPVKWRRSYLEGATNEVCRRLRESVQEYESMSLVVSMKQDVEAIFAGKGKSIAIAQPDAEAYQRGRQDGSRISLGEQRALGGRLLLA